MRSYASIRFLILVLAIFVVLAVLNRFGPSHAMMTTSTTARLNNNQDIRIFCFGDSLTAGTSPPVFATFPYAPYLEAALHQRGLTNTIVRHRGFPGWTTQQLVEDINGERGLVTALKAAYPVFIAIILAGTNDLGHGVANESIVRNVERLHQTCWDHDVKHTIAVGIPSSGYQARVPEVSEKSQAVNNALESWSQSRDVTFAPFPFAFAPDDDRWSPDGLHFSPKGYQILGESLASIVDGILSEKSLVD